MKFCPECGFDIRAFFANPDWKPKFCPECGMSLTAYLGTATSETDASDASKQRRSNSFIPYLGYPFLLGGMYAHEANEHANDASSSTDTNSAFAAGGGAFAAGTDGFDTSSFGDFGGGFGGDFGGGFDCGGFGC